MFGRSGGGWNNSWQIASALSSAYMAFGLFGPLEMGGVGYLRAPLDHFLKAYMSLVSASSSVFYNHFLFSVLILFLRFLIALLLVLFVFEVIELVLCSSCLALVFQSRVLLTAHCISAFHHGLAFSEGCAIFAVFCVASIRAS
jgi:hypothetical protein